MVWWDVVEGGRDVGVEGCGVGVVVVGWGVVWWRVVVVWRWCVVWCESWCGKCIVELFFS